MWGLYITINKYIPLFRTGLLVMLTLGLLLAVSSFVKNTLLYFLSNTFTNYYILKDLKRIIKI
jgi:hypothetical protein